LDRNSDTGKARKFLHIITAATRPLSLDEISLTMVIEKTHRSYDDLIQKLEAEERFRVTLRDLCGLFVVIIDAKIYLLQNRNLELEVKSLRLMKYHGNRSDITVRDGAVCGRSG
jgi:hypothetical protein